MSYSGSRYVCILLVSSLLLVAYVKATVTKASRAQDFVMGVGIDTHFNYGNTPYGDRDYIAGLLSDMGVKLIRDGSDRDYIWQYINTTLYTKYGIKAIMNFTPASFWNLQDMMILIKKYRSVIAAIEGPNEPDINNYSYNNKTGVAAAVSFQNDLYNAVKSDPDTKSLKVTSFAVAMPESSAKFAPLTSMDFEAIHSYPGGALPDDQLTTRWIPNANKLVGENGTPKPIVATETGYFTDTTPNAPCGAGQPGVSETAQAKYLSRLYADYWRNDIKQITVYELHEEGTEPCWGIVRYNKTKKPAFESIKSLIYIMSDTSSSATTFTPSSVDLNITAPSTVHYILFEKSPTPNFPVNFYLMIYNNVLVYDTKNNKDIVNNLATAKVSLNLKMNVAVACLIDGAGDISVSTNLIKNGDTTFSVDVADSITVVEIH